MIWYLIFLAVSSLIALVVNFLNMKESLLSRQKMKFSRLRVLSNWLLLAIFVGSIGGAGYATFKGMPSSENSVRTQHAQATSSSKHTVKKTSSKVDQLSVTYSPKKPIVSGDSLTVKFKVPAKAKLKIVGHYSGTTYKTFTNHHNKVTTFKYKFKADDTGTFDLVLTKNGHKTTKKFTVKSAADTDQSTQPSSAASSSSSSTSKNVGDGSSKNGNGGNSGSSGGSGGSTTHSTPGGSHSYVTTSSYTTTTTTTTTTNPDGTSTVETHTSRSN
jgi:uncharacterized membrane protein YgcG